MAEGLVLMSGKETDRLGVVRDAAEGRVRQRQAAERLGLGVRQRRPRRPCFGEMVQIEGMEYAWFEDRGGHAR